MKKVLAFIILAILPFILVWVAYLLTAFSFDAVTVFQSPAFWFMSVIYWFIFICTIGPMLDEFIID
jgi:hypothetical protein